jgi:hypothetical protein
MNKTNILAIFFNKETLILFFLYFTRMEMNMRRLESINKQNSKILKLL